MNLPVEDEVSDILSKAQKGQGISTDTLAARAGISESQVRGARRGDADSTVIASIARVLGLKESAVLKLAEGKWQPKPVAPLNGFEMVCSPFYDWKVNAFLVWDLKTKRAVAFDTGTKAAPLLSLAESKGLVIEAVILTHGHWDHCDALSEIKAKFPDLTAYLSAKETQYSVDAESIEEGFSYELGELKIEGFDTPGHTAGGMSFLIKGLQKEIAIAGDALFAGSMGGANDSYEAGLASMKRLLELDAETVLAPGHGPLTTVAEEREMNCFG